MYQGVIMSGFGGQGIVKAGILLAYAGMIDGKHVTFFPAYGAEMRGGTANCSVVISSDEVTSPVVPRPDTVIIMNQLDSQRQEIFARSLCICLGKSCQTLMIFYSMPMRNSKTN